MATAQTSDLNLNDFPRQAVVLIHGIGNQREFETITEFARGITPEPDPSKAAENTLTELVATDPLRGSIHLLGPDGVVRGYSVIESNNRMTDYYEMYWAHLAQTDGNTGRATLSWLWQTALGGSRLWELPRRWKHIPVNLRVLFRVTALLLLLLLAGVLFAYRLGWGSLVNEADWVWIGGLAGILGVWLAHAVLSVVGDAATYLYPCPETYQARENIRQAGARLLLELHAAREAGPDPDRASLKYERIIVVGHSLGSLIGYDILQYAFAHRNQYGNIEDILHQPSLRIGGAVPDLRKLGFVTVPDGPELSAVANIGRDLWRQEQDLAGADLVKAFDCRTGIRGIGRRRTGEYRKAQRALFSSLVRQVQAEGETGQRGGTGKTLDWRVSDFVTIGSPLTYAAFLLAPNVLPLKDSPSELENKNLAQRRERPESDWPINGWLERQKAGGVLPTCPPRGYYEDDNKDNKKTPRYFVASVGTHDERSAVLLNSALFALTRWTNLYVPSNGRFLFGDLLSGPLGPVFGLGISDRPLDPMAFSWRWPLRRFAHTRYWSRDPRDGRGNAKGGRPPLDRCSRGCA